MNTRSGRQVAVVFAVSLGLSLAALAGLGLLAQSGNAGPEGQPPRPPTPRPTYPPVTLVGAGDIADCTLEADTATAALLRVIEGVVFTAGDNAYPDGSAEDFTECYEPTWGTEKDRTRPTTGNHEYDTGTAQAHVDYFGARAAPAGTTWYSFTAGAWLVVMLDSECDEVGGCDDGSAQLDWLGAELAATDRECTLAIWHRPRFSSGYHGSNERMGPFWDVLHEAGAELIVNGHDHSYERFAAQDPSGAADSEYGIRQIVAGTGGANLRPFEAILPNSEVRDAVTHGVLRLTLRHAGYDWEFLPIAGGTFTDAGSGVCHGRPPVEPSP